ncbi:hypothetical protein T265_05984 [Opisthorchis viverrini]|uniref:Uncharacterized protein n=1 Tax=Opisthorchis viverrini TaxID=6198 RepID=A0A074ZHU1_OPIVI|nr:hypothetical protein T265_05984 [Opisthorchis viverrini]KER26853.1 hypothetical protein T265_05984 [Opisthorchis viverrini]
MVSSDKSGPSRRPDNMENGQSSNVLSPEADSDDTQMKSPARSRTNANLLLQIGGVLGTGRHVVSILLGIHK